MYKFIIVISNDQFNIEKIILLFTYHFNMNLPFQQELTDHLIYEKKSRIEVMTIIQKSE